MLEAFEIICSRALKIVSRNNKKTVHNIQKEIKELIKKFIRETGYFIKKTKKKKEQNLIREISGKFARALIIECIEIGPGLNDTILILVKEAIHEISYLEKIDEKELYELMNLKQINLLIPERKLNINDAEFCFIWNSSKELLKKLSNILYFENLIKSKGEFIKLFSAERNNHVLVRCNSDKIEYMVHLLSRLYKEKIIKTGKHKGLWKLTRRHFINFNGNPIKTDLKNLSSKVNRNYKEYRNTIDKVNEAVNSLQNIKNDVTTTKK